LHDGNAEFDHRIDVLAALGGGEVAVLFGGDELAIVEAGYFTIGDSACVKDLWVW
jgi:hypothetical protein